MRERRSPSLADALVHVAGQEEPPLRFAAGADAVAAFERRARNILAQADAYGAHIHPDQTQDPSGQPLPLHLLLVR